MDKVFYNGVIRTLDDNNTVAQAVGITDGKMMKLKKLNVQKK